MISHPWTLAHGIRVNHVGLANGAFNIIDTDMTSISTDMSSITSIDMISATMTSR